MPGVLKYDFNVRVFKYSFLLFLLLPLSALGQYNKNEIKAAYVERITRFVEWPEKISVRDTGVFVIGVFGDNSFFKILKASLKSKTIKDRIVNIVELSDLNKTELCDLCYLSGIDEADIVKLLTEANRKGVLVMAEQNGLGEKGIHINFYLEDNKLKFEINRSSIDSGKFKVSSMLLKSSRII